MNKKQDLIQRFEQQGYDRVSLRWVPKNPYGKKHKVSGWIYKLHGDSEWSKLGNNYEDAYKEIDLI
jgi:lipoprotein-anchoring transpeptidase ErfK/SrfK